MSKGPSYQDRQTLIEQARQHLAERLIIDSGQVELVEVRKVVWRDGSLGCPQPGKFYTQALVPGLCIRLRGGEKIHHYHSGGNRPPFFCPNPRECDAIDSLPGYVA